MCLLLNYRTACKVAFSAAHCVFDTVSAACARAMGYASFICTSNCLLGKAELSARDDESGVVLKYLRLATFIADAIGFEGNVDLQADGKAGAISEIHLEVSAIVVILVALENIVKLARALWLVPDGVL